MIYALIFVLVGIFAYKLISPRVTEYYCRERVTDAGDDKELIPELLRAFMPKSNVFSGISLPIPGKEGEEIYYGTVAVNSAGIFIICRICGEGLLENPPTADKWKLMSKGKVTEFSNPFRDQDSPRRLLAYYADAAGVGGVRVHTVMVYTNSGLRFANPPSKGVIHASSLYTRFRGMSKRGRLTLAQVSAISKMLSEVNAGNIDLVA